jgi:outer membrane lipoprotein carrier protein
MSSAAHGGFHARFGSPPRLLFVIRFALLVSLALLAPGADLEPGLLLKRVEDRYNRARTLQVQFQQTFSMPNRAQKTESGELFLQKPGRMRWVYTSPQGKLFLSDGKFIYLYTPSSNRVERSKVKESDDMRAPLAFLLGKLDFQRDFKTLIFRPQAEGTWVEAVPKSDRLLYTRVAFLVTPSFEIRRLEVTGQDRSVMEFRFENEKLNPRLDEALFRFVPPPGADVIDVTEAGD